jgi:hypothetical protein
MALSQIANYPAGMPFGKIWEGVIKKNAANMET